MHVIHWFRSDLRVDDNAALAAGCARAEAWAGLFVFDPKLLDAHARAAPRLRFLLESLADLARALETRGGRLVIRRGDPSEIVPALARETGADLVTWNRDYGPYAKARDAAVEGALDAAGIPVSTFKDRVVFEGAEIRTAAGGAYSVYTPYARAWWRRFEGSPPSAGPAPRIPPPPPGVASEPLPDPAELGIDVDATELPQAGAEAARSRLAEFLGGPVRRYAEDRDFPAVDGTSRLSPYLRLGAISPRECFREGLEVAAHERASADGVRKWLDELVWREFYHAVLDASPHVLRGAYRREYDALEWDRDPDRMEAWREGMTGYPFVDAAMRQLAATGWMHNRARMVVASFLTKDLHVDWREGERWFMERLVDGDPASNNGGWQWAASTGTDAQPYFRIFNPVSQGERFDPDGDYVRRWVPELEALPGKAAHQPWRAPLAAPGYPAPIVDHAVERREALARYKAVRGG